ncbi:hypothetical protein BP5796_01494 [Coleophoma crateriformis]|uniref:C2H2-type domain-containing protein n=1 Tax=Coleophoma crateriformis TaxID=565419 RepID=A0A3D8T0Q2_9HELO|nr:hypothetical protein BP5796_01494 [Coleophoma crateriformis]
MSGNFSQMGSQSRNYQMMPVANNNYQPQQYRASAPLMPQSSTAMSHPHPQPIAPAPANRVPQQLRPMPSGGLHMQSALNAPYGQNQMMGQQMLQDIEPPTHVVGSQGRRGILPSAPGRPAVTATGTGSTKNAAIPAKDADGKFPCPHCTKTYLHAKHLKRHLLRHTGDRPYMCVLCRDTFSRSDILKRHFQKCSIRRGNPTGASHLSHAQAHLKKSHPGPHKNSTSSLLNEDNGLMPNMNGMNNMSNDAMQHPFGIIPDGRIPDAGSSMTDAEANAALSRTNSMKRLSTGGARDGGSMAGPGPAGSNRASFDQNYAGGIPSTMAAGLPQAYSMSNGQNGHSYGQSYDYASHGNGTTPHSQSAEGISNIQNGRTVFAGASAPQHPSLDWAQMFQPGGQDGYMPYNQNIANGQMAIKQEPYAIKQEPSAQPQGLFTGVYPGTANGLSTVTDFPNWNMGASGDPLQQLSNQILNFAFPPNNQISANSNEIRKNLSAENIKHYLECFTNFQGHFPLIHMPTFKIVEAYEGLLLAMICIGAIYSSRITPSQVRDLMELSKVCIERNSDIHAMISRELQSGSGQYNNQTIGTTKSELEQIQAIVMINVIFIWHGTPVQRENARRQFPLIIALARRAGLTQPTPSSPFSILHQPAVNIEQFNPAHFDWNAWVEQERRSRLLYMIFLTDAAMVIYFNIPPKFDTLEIRLPLPADDAAWDAKTAQQCADALGLHGPVAARDKNPEGSRRPRQPEMHSALKALLHNVYDLQPGTTNLYSKFILVHALHIQLWSAQKQVSLESTQMNGQQVNGQTIAFPSSGTSTPISQNDWITRGTDPSSGAGSVTSSGRATPVGDSHAQQLIKTANNAFDKWKKAWDEDMAAQYPPSSTSYRRFGFCRDGVHFYWLAKWLVKNTRVGDWNIAPDQRFTQVMHLLKSVKTWVVSDSAKRGEELGSVSDIDKDYGVTDLTLDMAQLFKPINKQIDSPVAGLHTAISNTMG